MKIACVTTCRGRVDHLQRTLPENLKALRGNSVLVLLDYNDQDGLGYYIQSEHRSDIEAGRLVYYHYADPDRFYMAHAKNMAHRCAMLESADILVTLDADNFMGDGFIEYVASRFSDPELSFMCPDFKALPPPGQRFDFRNPVRLGRGFAGRLAIRAQDFLKAGGYNEVFDTWRGEDIDLIARLDRLGLKKAAINPLFLNAIPHSSEVRFREYPHAKKYENDAIFSATEKAYDTVVNFGDIGVGQVTRNFELECINLGPVPTRIFGLGFQRTGTSSLHAAFQSFGYDSAHWLSAEWARSIWWETNKWGRSRTLEQSYAISDNPIPVLYKKLDVAYPGSKFVLTVRDENEWLASIEQFWTYDGNPQRWTWDEDGFSHKMHGILYGRIDFNAEVFLARYRKHNDDVTRYFAGRDNFLRIDVNEYTTMEALTTFLGVPVSQEKFPHHNKGSLQ